MSSDQWRVAQIVCVCCIICCQDHLEGNKRAASSLVLGVQGRGYVCVCVAGVCIGMNNELHLVFSFCSISPGEWSTTHTYTNWLRAGSKRLLFTFEQQNYPNPHAYTCAHSSFIFTFTVLIIVFSPYYVFESLAYMSNYGRMQIVSHKEMFKDMPSFSAGPAVARQAPLGFQLTQKW